MKGILHRIFWREIKRSYGSFYVRRAWWDWLTWEGTAFLVVVGLILGGIFGGVYVVSVKSCDAVSDRTGRTTEWDFWAGCFIEADDGSFIHEDNFRVNESGEAQP